jgi:SAM-dependent methyltransferase
MQVACGECTAAAARAQRCFDGADRPRHKPVEHDPEKWVPVSRLREALARFVLWLDASAGEGRSDKDHARTISMAPMPQVQALFDRALLAQRRRRAAALGPVTFLIDRVAEDMVERLSAVRRTFEVAVDLGTPTDAVRRAIRPAVAAGRIVAAIPEPVADCAGPVVVADEEHLPFRDASLDLVVSGLALQFVNDLPGALVQIRRALKPDGLFLAALVGGDTLTELRHAFAAAEAGVEGGASPRVAPFADVRAMGALLQRAGFALPVADVDHVCVRYDSPVRLMHDLRRMGATNALAERRRAVLRRATLARLVDVYAERFADPDGRVRASFDIIWLSGWAPHASQQQPLRPGSARMRLADALGTQELSAGEKPGGDR